MIIMKKSRKAFCVAVIMYIETLVQFFVMIQTGFNFPAVFVLFIVQIAIFCIIGSLFIYRFEKQEKKETSCN